MKLYANKLEMLALLACILSQSPAAAQLNEQACMFRTCSVGAIVSTVPGSKALPVCATAPITSYVHFVWMNPDRRQEREPIFVQAEDRLRAYAAVNSYEDALKSCSVLKSRVIGRVVENGPAKSGLLLVAPRDGRSPFWVSNLDTEPVL